MFHSRFVFSACCGILCFSVSGQLLSQTFPKDAGSPLHQPLRLAQGKASPPTAAPPTAGDILEISQDTTLDPQRSYGRILVTASNITIDGHGAWLIGPGQDQPTSFQQTAVSAKGVSNVTLRNVRAKGWERALHVRDGSGWVIENCDFSDNFHDPDFGWGENGRRGGILLERVQHSTLRNNRVQRVWDSCVLVDSHDNLIETNAFSHSSNTCLKLWASCRNIVRNNDLSYGLRISPGEVHARDSASVLIESGSNDNRFVANDCTHGGDGIFIRVLNQWISTGNTFIENDCSYANNNCVEAWSPGNHWIRNRANHGSYGFWLGASDQNVLLENEASYNGLPSGFHNSPHLPDNSHAGIVFMFGPSSHTIVRANRCVGNHGAGIAAIGDLESRGAAWNAFHWIIEQNTLQQNRWGIFLQHAQMLSLAANRFERNELADVWIEDNVAECMQRSDRPNICQPPHAELVGPQVVQVNQLVTWDAAGSRDPDGLPLTFCWRIPPNIVGRKTTLTHSFAAPGFYRVALTVNNGLLSDLAWRDLYVTEPTTEWGTEEATATWSWTDPESQVKFILDSNLHLVGKHSLRAHVQPYSGGRVTLTNSQPSKPLPLEGKTRLVFWLKTRNENIPGWQDLNPRLALIDPTSHTYRLTPDRDFLSRPPYNEARDGWTYFAVPLTGNSQWKPTGKLPTSITAIEFGFDAWGAPPLTIWIDGLSIQ